LKLFDKKEVSILKARRTYYPLGLLKDKIFTKVSLTNVIMGWVKKADVITSNLIKQGKKGKFNLNILHYDYKDHKILRSSHVSVIDREKIFNETKRGNKIVHTRDEIGVELGTNLNVEGVVYPVHRCSSQRFKFSDAEMLTCMVKTDDSYMNEINMRGFYASGSWHTNKIDIERFGDDSGLNLTHWDFLSKIKGKLTTLKFPVINRIPQAKEVYTQGVNPYSGSGYNCSKLIGKTKNTAFKIASDLSYDLFNKLKHRFRPDCSLWSVGGRERLHTPDEDGNCDIKSRAVLSPEMIVSQICQVFARPITDMLSLINIEDPNYSLHLGSDMFEGKFQKLVAKCKTFKTTICSDWSRYDQSIGRGQIVLAFAICRSAFPISVQVDKLFLFILSSFLVKRVVGDGGIVYKITKGIPTGHPFTSVVNTLVNFITFSYLEHECKVDFPFKKFYGDDTILSTNDPNVSFEKLKEASKKLFNMTLKLESDKGFINDENIEDSASFLKYRSSFGLPARSKSDLIKTISFYRKGYLYHPEDRLQRGLSFLYCSPFDKSFVKLIKAYCSQYRVVDEPSSIKETTQLDFDIYFNDKLNKVIEFLSCASNSRGNNNDFTTIRWLPGDVLMTKRNYDFYRLDI
jgi:hypothetical protein